MRITLITRHWSLFSLGTIAIEVPVKCSLRKLGVRLNLETMNLVWQHLVYYRTRGNWSYSQSVIAPCIHEKLSLEGGFVTITIKDIQKKRECLIPLHAFQLSEFIAIQNYSPISWEREMGDRVNLTGSIKEQISDQRVKYFISPNKKKMIIFDVQSIRKTKKTASMLDLTPAANTPCMMSSSPR